MSLKTLGVTTHLYQHLGILKNFSPSQVALSFSFSCQRVFDGLFSTYPFSWKFFGRACIASLISTTICLLMLVGFLEWDTILHTFHFHQSTVEERIVSKGGQYSSLEYTFCLFLIPLGLNLLADFFSYAKTSFFMSMVGEEEPTYKILTVLILDYVATYIAFILGVLILIVVFSGILFGGSVLGTGIDQIGLAKRATLEHLSHLLGAMNQPIIMVPCMASTFFTSIWLWLHGGSLILARCWSQVGKFGRLIRLQVAPKY